MSMNREEILKIYEKYRAYKFKGDLADYIPELARVDINNLGIYVRADEAFGLGAYNLKFTIQSISKILSLIVSLEENGYRALSKRINFKPTEDPFNSLYRLDFKGQLPANPMLNSGAILNTSLIEGRAIDKILDLVERITNKRVDYNRAVYESEKATADKNKAIAYLLKSRGLIDKDLDLVLDDYFKQCSIEMDLEELSLIGYVLGNSGLGLEGERIIDENIVRIVNASILSCGMYNQSGEFAIEVGLPSKSGVSGAILTVIPRRGCLAVYSPGLDSTGNSYLGTRILKDISDKFKLSIF